MTREELDKVLDLHKRWLNNEDGGERAYLQGVDLRGVDLQGANLRYVDLRGANLQGVNLRYADLYGANLQGADIEAAKLPHYKIVPEEGSFIGWKKLCNGSIVKLQIPASAGRVSSLVGRKCRASKVKVLKIFGAPGAGTHYPLPSGQQYEEGKIIYPDKYDDDIRVECAKGIHFFLTRQEAEEWIA